jgi:hypothetical protein
MIAELSQAQRRLQAAGLTVRAPTDDSLWIAGHLTAVEPNLHLSQDACGLQGRCKGEYVAVFPSAGHVTIEVPGTIPDLVSLILATYLRHRRVGGPFHEAVGLVLREADRWPLAEVA